MKQLKGKTHNEYDVVHKTRRTHHQRWSRGNKKLVSEYQRIGKNKVVTYSIKFAVANIHILTD